MDQPEKCSKCNGKHFYRNEDGDWECFECSKIFYDIEPSVQAEICPKPSEPSAPIGPIGPVLKKPRKREGFATTCPGCGKELYIFPWRIRMYPLDHQFYCIHCVQKRETNSFLKAVKELALLSREHKLPITVQFERLTEILVKALKSRPQETIKSLQLDVLDVGIVIAAAAKQLVKEQLALEKGKE
jgi:hypothetical protein